MILALSLLVAASGLEDADTRAAMAALRGTCYECHGPEQQKARLRLDLAEGLLSVVTPGKPAESELLRRISLLPGDDDVMPPKGELLSAEQIRAIERWIAAGAPTELLESVEDRAPLDAVEGASGVRLVSADGGGLRAEFAYSDSTPTAASIAALAPIAGRIVELGLAGTGAGPGTLAELPLMPRLERAHLERTTLGDADMVALIERAPNLRYLNLHSTAVTDASAFDRLASLERLVLYGTPAGTQGAEPVVPFFKGGPRQILVADRERAQLILLREVALENYTIVSRRTCDDPQSEVTRLRQPLRNIRDSRQLRLAREKGLELSASRYCQELSSGHLVLSMTAGPQLVELDEDGEVVWSFSDERFTEPFDAAWIIEDPYRWGIPR